MRGETMCKEVVDSTRASLEKAGDFDLKKNAGDSGGNRVCSDGYKGRL